MDVSTEAVKELRDRTCAGMLECKKALVEAEGDVDKAIKTLRQRGIEAAEKRQERAAVEGIVSCYVHHTGKIGALIELNCETDFVARTQDFGQLAYELAMQVAATCPQCLGADELPVQAEVAPEEACLLLQPSIKEPTRTIADIITDAIARTGENIRVRRFSRFEVGC